MIPWIVFAVLSVMPGADKAEVKAEVLSRLQEPMAVASISPLAVVTIPEPPEPDEEAPDVFEDAPPSLSDAPMRSLPNSVCQPGRLVMIPDGREGQVTSYEAGICRVLAYGEAYVSLWTDELIEPVYPQALPRYRFGH
jgi:hypothetical protein